MGRSVGVRNLFNRSTSEVDPNLIEGEFRVIDASERLEPSPPTPATEPIVVAAWPGPAARTPKFGEALFEQPRTTFAPLFARVKADGGMWWLAPREPKLEAVETQDEWEEWE
jgi:hypothetical protein